MSRRLMPRRGVWTSLAANSASLTTRPLCSPPAAARGRISPGRYPLPMPIPPPPDTPREEVVDSWHGEEVVDPYRWLEGQSDRIRAWTDAQNARTRAALDAVPARGQ